MRRMLSVSFLNEMPLYRDKYHSIVGLFDNRKKNTTKKLAQLRMSWWLDKMIVNLSAIKTEFDKTDCNLKANINLLKSWGSWRRNLGAHFKDNLRCASNLAVVSLKFALDPSI